MKIVQISVTRKVEVPGQSDIERGTKVNFRKAEDAAEMLAICGGNLNEALAYFNDGRWSEIRTKASNALAGKSPEQKAVEKMTSAFMAINKDLTEEQARTIVLSMPNMATAASNSGEILPAEIEDTFFDEKKAAKQAESQPVSQSA